MSEELLEEVPLDEIPFVLKTLKSNFKRYYPLPQYIEIFKEYKDDKIEEPKQTLLRFGTVEDGVYVIETIFTNGGIPYFNFFIYSSSIDTSDVKNVLSKTHRIPWHIRGFSIQVVFKNIAPAIHEVAMSKGMNLKSVDGIMMWSHQEDTITTDGHIPVNMELKCLSTIHVQEICQMWPNRFPGCEFYLGTQIRNNFGLGLFRKADDKMVSSAISFHSGGIFVLNTHPDFRRKGYAEIVIKNMIKETFKRGKMPFAIIHRENKASQELFKKVGLKELAVVEHIFPEGFR